MRKNYFTALLLLASFTVLLAQKSATSPQKEWQKATQLNTQIANGNKDKKILLEKIESLYSYLSIPQSKDLFFYNSNEYHTMDSTWTYEINSEETEHLLSQKDFYRYDTNQKLVEHIATRWFIASKSWVNSGRTTYQYDGEGRIKTISTYLWGETKKWEKNYKYEYNYNNDNNIATIYTFYHKRETDEWTELHTEIYRYDQNGMLVQRVKKAAEFFGGLFVSKVEYSYNDNKQVASSIYQEYKNNAWAMRDKYTFAYDENGNCVERIRDGYYNGTWQPAFRFTFEYDKQYTAQEAYIPESILNLLGDVVQEIKNPLLKQTAYSTTRKGWDEGGVTALTYKKNITNSIQNHITTTDISIYPNPTSNSFYIDTHNHNIGLNSIIRIYDSNGKIVKREAFDPTKSIDITTLQKGNYLFVITPNNKQQTSIGGKIIKK